MRRTIRTFFAKCAVLADPRRSRGLLERGVRRERGMWHGHGMRYGRGRSAFAREVVYGGRAMTVAE